MKMNQLTMAIAVASVVVSSAAVAGDKMRKGVASSVPVTITGEAFGAYRDRSDEGAAIEDTSDWDLDEIRLGVHADLGGNTTASLELRNLPGDRTGTTNTSDTEVLDLFIAKQLLGNATVTAGRFKSITNRDAAVEQSDSLFNDTFNPDSVYSMRRIDGIEVKSTFEGDFHGSVSVFKGGQDTSGASEEKRQFGYGLSAGWQGGNDDARFGATIYMMDADGDDDGTTSSESSSFGVNTFLATGPIVATLGYGDSEDESTTGGVTTSDETDGIMLQGAFDLGGAARTFNAFGVLQGPSLAAGERGYEAVLNYTTGENDDGTTKTDLDGWGIGLNMYCGANTKWFIQYDSTETDAGGAFKPKADGISLGGRYAF